MAKVFLIALGQNKRFDLRNKVFIQPLMICDSKCVFILCEMYSANVLRKMLASSLKMSVFFSIAAEGKTSCEKPSDGKIIQVIAILTLDL